MVKLHPFLNPIMHDVFNVVFANWGINLPHHLPKYQMTKNEELKLCRNSNYYMNFCFKWLPLKTVRFLLTSEFFFLVDEHRIVLLLKRPQFFS